MFFLKINIANKIIIFGIHVWSNYLFLWAIGCKATVILIHYICHRRFFASTLAVICGRGTRFVLSFCIVPLWFTELRIYEHVLHYILPIRYFVLEGNKEVAMQAYFFDRHRTSRKNFRTLRFYYENLLEIMEIKKNSRCSFKQVEKLFIVIL